MVGVYKIVNLINGKIYIGQSQNIERRWREHKRESKNIKNNTPLYYAMRKYGIENFYFEIIEECSVEELNEKEIFYIEQYNSYINTKNSKGYNQTYGGDCGNRGFKFSKESKEKLSKAHKGKKLSEELVQQISERMTGGKHFSAKTVICENREFSCAKECAEYYGVPKTSLRNWLNGSRKMPKEWYDKGLRYKEINAITYETQQDRTRGNARRVKRVECESLTFSCAKDCAEFYNINYSTMRGWLNGHNKMPQEWIDKGLKYL